MLADDVLIMNNKVLARVRKTGSQSAFWKKQENKNIWTEDKYSYSRSIIRVDLISAELSVFLYQCSVLVVRIECMRPPNGRAGWTADTIGYTWNGGKKTNKMQRDVGRTEEQDTRKDGIIVRQIRAGGVGQQINSDDTTVVDFWRPSQVIPFRMYFERSSSGYAAFLTRESNLQIVWWHECDISMGTAIYNR